MMVTARHSRLPLHQIASFLPHVYHDNISMRRHGSPCKGTRSGFAGAYTLALSVHVQKKNCRESRDSSGPYSQGIFGKTRVARHSIAWQGEARVECRTGWNKIRPSVTPFLPSRICRVRVSFSAVA
ncbi:hypothetical protein AG1IA_04741 [Rhizoctonia solani AG-1 IA]|uniref:Uncharacterized protein n=1 Tax=Thanatephorus cucumeris (strain AG1-IA) TaxID=983506 RepID=L8WY04_THACA|nr:hypothetical protein AG1IA_04741 [Rhizoctonia solani AG-1 IA]